MIVKRDVLLPDHIKIAAKAVLKKHLHNGYEHRFYIGLCAVTQEVIYYHDSTEICDGATELKWIINTILQSESETRTYWHLPPFLRDRGFLPPGMIHDLSFRIRVWWLETIINEGRAIGFTEV